jgi:hypothetical protein
MVHFAQSLQIILVGLKHPEHFVFSDNFPPQFRHDSSGNSIQRYYLKIEYKRHEEIVHPKDQ